MEIDHAGATTIAAAVHDVKGGQPDLVEEIEGSVHGARLCPQKISPATKQECPLKTLRQLGILQKKTSQRSM